MKTTVACRTVGGHAIQCDVLRTADDVKRPVIVWLHGGGLIMGGREWIDRRVRAIAQEENTALVSFDYRLAPETKLPDIVGDIEAAFAWLRGEGAERFSLDADQVVVCGNSAGGYLTLVTGYRVRPRPSALVSLYGYGELSADWYSKPSNHPRHNARVISGEEAEAQTDGAVVSNGNNRRGDGGLIYLHYRQNGLWPREVSGFNSNVLQKRIAEYEPLHNVDKDYPPTLLIHGDMDTDVPYDESEKMADAFKKCGVRHELITIENGEHGFDGGDPDQINNSYATIRAFIVEHLDGSDRR